MSRCQIPKARGPSRSSSATTVKGCETKRLIETKSSEKPALLLMKD